MTFYDFYPERSGTRRSAIAHAVLARHDRAVGFKKPFQAKPVVLGEYARAHEARRRRQSRLRLLRKVAVGTGIVFLLGMAVTHRRALPTYYPNCSFARAAGAAPIYRGQPGYRPALDADDDGIACEPYPAHRPYAHHHTRWRHYF